MIEKFIINPYSLTDITLMAELFISASIIQLTFFGFFRSTKNLNVALDKPYYYIGILILLLGSFLSFNEDLLYYRSLNNSIQADFLSFLAKQVILIVSLLFLIFISAYNRKELLYNSFEYVVLILISVLGLMFLCSANDLITAYLAIELQSVAFYLMAAFKKDSNYSIESGLKYFIIGALSSALFLFGSSLLYGCFGTLYFHDFHLLSSFLNLKDNPRDEYLIPVPFSFVHIMTYVMSLDFLGDGMVSPYVLTLFFINNQLILDFWSMLNSEWTDEISLPYSEIHNISFKEFDSSLKENCFEFNYLKLSFFHILLFDASSREAQLELIAGDCLNHLYDHVIKKFRCYFTYLWILHTLKVAHTDYTWGLFDLCGQYEVCIVPSTTLTLTLSNLFHPNLNPLISVGFVLIMISLFIKLAAAPFHYWSLDVYEGSPNSTTFFFAVVPKLAVFVLLLRLCYASLNDTFLNYQIYFFAVAVFSIFVGSFGGLEQRKVKTLLAYSSVSHTGYLLLSFSTCTFDGMQMLFYYMIIFMLAGLCFWSSYLFVKQKSSRYSDKHNKELGDLTLLKNSNPALALIIAITLFSMAGIPPMVGFLAKIGIFFVTVKSSAYIVALFSILLSVISTFYYIRVIKVIYFENVLVGKLYEPVSTKSSILIAVLALSLIFLTLDPTVLYLLCHKALLFFN